MNIMVENTGKIDLAGIRLLGLSRKSKEQIGQFGTGLKEAVTMLLREGKQVVIFSGDLRVDFEIQSLPGVGHDEVCFMLSEDVGPYPAGTWHGMGIHPNFGHRDWHSAYQALREIFCNAWDESDMDHTLTGDEPCGKEGKTRVYIMNADRDLQEAYVTLSDKLLFMSQPKVICETRIGRILQKNNRTPETQIFTKGVFVQKSNLPGLFDYDFTNLKLNESRSADWYAVSQAVGEAIATANVDVVAKFLSMISDKGFEKFYEHTIEAYYIRTNLDEEVWKSVWVQMYGDKAVAYAGSDPYYPEKLKKKGMKPICVLSKYLNVLEVAGIPTYLTILDKDTQKKLEVTGKYDTSIVWNRLELLGMVTKACPPGLTFKQQKTEGCEILHGFVRDGRVYMNEAFIGCAEERRTALEECIHFETGENDGSLGLQNWLIAQMDTLMWSPR